MHICRLIYLNVNILKVLPAYVLASLAPLLLFYVFLNHSLYIFSYNTWRPSRITPPVGSHQCSDNASLCSDMITALVQTLAAVIGLRWWSHDQQVLRNFLLGQYCPSYLRYSCGSGCLYIHVWVGGIDTTKTSSIPAVTHISSLQQEHHHSGI